MLAIKEFFKHLFVKSGIIQTIFILSYQNKSEFSKILILVDGSQPSINAADRAIALAKKEKDSGNPQLLIALHVVFSHLGYAYSSAGAFGSTGITTPDAVRELLEDAKKEAQQWFNKIKEKINNINNNNNNNIELQTEVIVTATSIVSAIIEYAKNKNVDLIITGTRGRSKFKKLLLGSVASGVITQASSPVMVVK
jgi:nucleotide-binding universal stress UspA family protein